MKKIVIVIILLMIIPTIVNAITIDFKGGYGIFLMKDIRDMVEDSGTNTLGGLDIVLKFQLFYIKEMPISIGAGHLFTVIVTKKEEGDNIGGHFVSKVKEIPWALPLMLTVKYPLEESEDKNTKLKTNISLGGTYIRLGKEVEVTSSGGDTGSLMNYYSGWGPLVECGLELGYKYWEDVDIGIEVGLRFLRSIRLTDDNGEEPKKSDGNKLNVDFSGIYCRLGLTMIKW